MAGDWIAPESQMSSADFLLAPEVQKLLKVVFAEPSGKFSVNELAKRTRLGADDVARTQEHLVKSGILTLHSAEDDEPESVSANPSFVFYGELRNIALKSFAAAEPLRAMLRSKFKDSVLRAFVLGESTDGTVEVLVVHGQLVPDEAAMSAACRKLSASIGRHLNVHVISSRRFTALTSSDSLGRKVVAPSAIEIIAEGETKAKPQVEGDSLLESARAKLAALAKW